MDILVKYFNLVSIMINYEIGIRYFQISFPFDLSEKGKCIMSDWEINKNLEDTSFKLSLSDLEKSNYQSKDLKYLNLNDKLFEDDVKVIKENCRCFTCSNNYSRAYIHHLLKCQELNAGVLLSL